VHRVVVVVVGGGGGVTRDASTRACVRVRAYASRRRHVDVT